MAEINVEEVLKKLSTAEKVDLLTGIDMWHTKAIPRLGIPSIRLSDGPNGVRGTKFFNGLPAACFPCGTALGSTFNTELLEEAGRKMGEEARVKGAHAILGPTINIQRSPLGGRGFESLGEDPVLSGLGAAALINGIQSTGVQAAIKHFVCNDHEHKRNAVQVIITERALREIYALPFQLTVRDSNPGSFMTAYNGINGTFCSENPKLLQKMLREEWGWNGMVMSDWWGTYSTTEAIKAGLDLEMPGSSGWRGDRLKFSMATEKVWAHVLDERVRAVLKFVKKCMESGIPENAPESIADTAETSELLRRLGNEGIVLLKNENKVLPFKKDKKTLVIGPNAKTCTYHGGGSASLASYYAVTPFDGISSKLITPPEYAIGEYSHKMLPLLGYSTKSLSGKPGFTMKVYNDDHVVLDRVPVDEIEILKTELHLVDYENPKLKSSLWYATLEADMVPEEDWPWELGLVVCGSANLYVNDQLIIDNTTKQTWGDTFYGTGTVEEKGYYSFEKGKTYRIKVTFGSIPTSKLQEGAPAFGGGSLRIGGCKAISAKQEIERAAEMAKTADQVIICTGLNADWETEGNDRASMDLPYALHTLIVAVGTANPRTAVVLQSGTPVTMKWAPHVGAVMQAWYGGNETGNCIADVLFGDVNPSGKLSLSFPIRNKDNPAFLNYRTEGGRVLYGEDIYVGYRYYEYAEKEVMYPFGHGLSYTNFSFSECTVTEKDGKITVNVTIKNTGEMAGKEVVQVYVKPLQQAKVNRPVKELKGFTKLALEIGESKVATVEMETKYAASYWDEERDKWCVEAGKYEVIASDSSEVKDDKAVKGFFTVDQTFWWSGV